jgi:hypothetical protein
VAASSDSYTGRYLKSVLPPPARARRAGGRR